MSKNESDFIIVNSEVVVKSTAALSEKIKEELEAEIKEVDIEELLNDENNTGND